MTRIKHLRDRTRYVRLGKVSRGVQVEALTEKGKPKMKNGKPVTYPKAVDHFVVHGEWPGAEEEVALIYGLEPKELDIEFLFDEEDQTFPQSMILYRADRQVRCRGNGETVTTRRHIFKGEDSFDASLVCNSVYSDYLLGVRVGFAQVTAYNERTQEEWARDYGWPPTGTEIVSGQPIPCLGPECPQYGPSGCRATARLRFGIRGVRRFGFWEMVVHQYAIIGINSQLDLTRAFTRSLIGVPTILNVPFKLRLTGPQQMPIPRKTKDAQGNVVIEERLTDVWTPEIQPDPTWIAQAYEAREARGELPEPQQIAPPAALGLSIPDEEERLDFDPDVSGENGEEDETTPEVGKLSDDQMTRFWAYAKRKAVEGSAKSILAKCGGDFEKALIELRQNCGEL